MVEVIIETRKEDPINMSLNDSENGIHRSENDHLVSLVQLLSKKNGKIFDESVAELLDWFDGQLILTH